MVKLWATLCKSVQPCASAKERIPRQLDGWSCFIKNLQHASTTWESWRRQAVDNRHSILSSFNSRRPSNIKRRVLIIYERKNIDCNSNKRFFDRLSEREREKENVAEMVILVPLLLFFIKPEKKSNIELFSKHRTKTITFLQNNQKIQN